MLGKQKTIYPILSQKKIEQLVRRLEVKDEIKVDFVNANKDNLALNIGLTNKGEGPLDNEWIDGLLGIIGFEFKPCSELDSLYGETEKYYTFRKRNDLWVAWGDNGYYKDWTRILVNWGEKVDRKKFMSISEVYSGL